MSRSTLSTSLGLALATLALTSCSEPPIVPVPGATVVSTEGRAAVHRDFTPASVGWQEQGRALVGANNLSPLAAARVYAALSVAQYRAVVSVDRGDRDDKKHGDGFGKGGRSGFEARRGAVAGASAQVLSFFFPAAAGSLEERVVAEGTDAEGNMHPRFERGLAIGRSAGDALVERTRNDRFTTPWTGSVPPGPGKWIANGPPAGPTFGGVDPYFLTSGDQFRPAAPPEFGSTAFLTDLGEIRALSDNRTPAQQAIALFWNFPTGTFTPPGYWNVVASNYVQEFGLGERAATHTFALTHAAAMDALIGCWDAKYNYWMLRPTQADPQITLSFPLPNHPSYPSGHSCVSSAAAKVLSHLFPKKTSELDAWVTEAGLSRMYAGIHYRFDITAGKDLGVAVARWAIRADRRYGLLEAIEK